VWQYIYSSILGSHCVHFHAETIFKFISFFSLVQNWNSYILPKYPSGQTQRVFEAGGISGSSGRAPNQFYIYEHIVKDSFARYMSKII
jgi:hypothetical protein